jgi:hypothetical protein
MDALQEIGKIVYLGWLEQEMEEKRTAWAKAASAMEAQRRTLMRERARLSE